MQPIGPETLQMIKRMVAVAPTNSGESGQKLIGYVFWYVSNHVIWIVVIWIVELLC